MIILGVNGGIHDGSAAVLREGELVAMVEGDRVTRVKRGWKQSPAAAVRTCLDLAGLTLDQVDGIAVGWGLPAYPAWPGERYAPGERLAFLEWLIDPDTPHSAVFGSARRDRPARPLPQLPPVTFVGHHEAHAAASLWTSGFQDAAVVVADGRGEVDATSIGGGDGDGIHFARRWPISASLGNYYGIAAEWAGLDFWDAGKLMGLAPYGRHPQPMPLVRADDGYVFKGLGPPSSDLDNEMAAQRRFLEQSFAEIYPFAKGSGADVMSYADFAASAQAALEEAVVALASSAAEIAGTDRLVLGGGVAMNCTLVGRLVRSTRFCDVHVPPFPYDAGVSVGAALVADRARPDWEPPERISHAFLGVALNERTVAEAIAASGLPAMRLGEPELVGKVADLLAAGGVVGWCQGRAEVGQRALGARSILADPRDRRTLVRVNRLKGRETWRPLAPSALEEYAGKLFEGPFSSASQYMLAAHSVRAQARRMLRATTHVDGSARPQFVSQSVQPRYWQLIECFRQRTSVPAVLNTSFNLAGEPIVHSVHDAMSTFQRADLDALAIGDYLVLRPGADERLLSSPGTAS